MASKRLSILHLVSSERWTGAAEPVISLAKSQSAEGHCVWLAIIGGYNFEEKARESGIQVVTHLTLDRRLFLPNLRADYKYLRQFVEEKSVDVIHTHLLHDNWLAGLALRDFERPHLLTRTMHRFDRPRADMLHKWLFCKRTDRIVTTSEAMKKRILDRLALPPDGVDVVYGGVDFERFGPDADSRAIRDEYAIPHDAPVAGIVARLRKGRGHDWLLRVIPRVLERLPEAHFLIVGRGEIKKPVRARIAQMPERDRIHMIGYRDGDLAEAYAAMDCNLFLGQGSEGTCRAVLEAMACARPVIGAREAGVPEIIDDGKTGRLVEKQNDDDLFGALVDLLGDRDATRALGRAARKECEIRFTEARRLSDNMKSYRAAWQKKYGEEL